MIKLIETCSSDFIINIVETKNIYCALLVEINIFAPTSLGITFIIYLFVASEECQLFLLLPTNKTTNR